MRLVMLVSVAAMLTLVACRDSVGPAGMDQASQSIPEGLATPTFNWLNGPPTPGNSGVVRGESAFAIFLTTLPDGELFARHSPVDNVFGCRPITVFITQPFQLNPNTFQFDGEMWVTVFDNTLLSPPFPC